MTPHQSPRRRGMLAVALVFEGALLLLALAIGYWMARPPLTQIAWNASGLLWGLAATAPMVAGLLILSRWPGPLAELFRLVGEQVVPLFRGCTWLDLLAISLLAGFGEEFLFRGVLQRGIEHFTGSILVGLLVASIVFGLAHAISLAYAVLAALIGLYFGWLLVASDNLLVPIVAHAAYDFVALVYLVYFETDDEPQVPVAEQPPADTSGTPSDAS